MRIAQCANEEQTKLYLVLPFLRLLGYDALDPSQVIAKSSADFSEKYKNRVDFLLMANGIPAIALECKSCGAELKGARGQLKSYFNALSGGRVGALTNGMEYEFFINSAEPNHMEDEPFLSLSLKSLTNGAMRTDVIDTLERLTRARFDADHIIGQARQRLLKEELVRSKTPLVRIARSPIRRAH